MIAGNYNPLDDAAEDYMSHRQIAFFRAKLLEMQAAGRVQDQQDGAPEHVSDPLDRATQEEHAVAERSRLARATARLAEIRAALQRIEAGDYGFCAETGEEIGLARLLANPMASLSVQAQAQKERFSKLHNSTTHSSLAIL